MSPLELIHFLLSKSFSLFFSSPTRNHSCLPFFLYLPFSKCPIFFVPPGTKDLESVVLEYISNVILEGRWVAGSLENNIICLGDIQRGIRQNHPSHNIRDISFEQFIGKYRRWRRSYYKFSFLTSNPHMDYAFFYTDNPPNAINLMWEELSEVCPWVLYYCLRGKRHWSTLENMFQAPLDSYLGVGPFQ